MDNWNILIENPFDIDSKVEDGGEEANGEQEETPADDVLQDDAETTPDDVTDAAEEEAKTEEVEPEVKDEEGAKPEEEGKDDQTQTKRADGTDEETQNDDVDEQKPDDVATMTSHDTNDVQYAEQANDAAGASEQEVQARDEQTVSVRLARTISCPDYIVCSVIFIPGRII